LGEAYLKAMAHSLLRQGFRTQIWVWHEKDKLMYGKYVLVGHIEDLPLAGELPQRPDRGHSGGRGGGGATDGAAQAGRGAAADDPWLGYA
jgi:hypothetical protein